jgi:hypothetical protein
MNIGVFNVCFTCCGVHSSCELFSELLGLYVPPLRLRGVRNHIDTDIRVDFNSGASPFVI